jgi:Ca2+-binding RTX toxin-like protein/murein DD-endopeptidase MepM/ murein hydrolase activator NlpD/uncharacterized protein YcfL
MSVTISIEDAWVGEGDGTALLWVRLSEPSASPVSVSWRTRWWDYVEGRQPARDDYSYSTELDYAYTEGVLTFAPGETALPINVQLFDDTAVEFAEALQVELRFPSGAMMGRSRATATIVDDDVIAALPVMSVSDMVVDEKAGWADLVVRLDAASAGLVSVNYATVDGTALAGSDYAAVSGVLAFAPGEVVKTVRVAVLDDSVVEGAEAFRLALSNVQGAQVGQAQARVVIAPNDGPVQTTPTVSIEDAWVGEGDGVAQLLVRLSGPAADPVSVTWRTRWWDYVEGRQPARDGYSYSTELDYSYTDGSLTFAPGEVLKTISVPLYDDAVAEPLEALQVELRFPSGATLGRSRATATVIDNDTIAAMPAITVSDMVVDEKAGWADLVVRLDAASAGTVSVTYATVDGTALAGSDYGAVSGVLAFAPGEMVKTVRVSLLDDTAAEGAETFRLALSNAQGATLAQAQARVVIAGNDGPVQAMPTISIEDAWVGEGDGVAQLLVRLSGPSADPVSVTWRTRWWDYVEGRQPARDGYSYSTELDYAYTDGSLTFAPGEVVKSISVPLYDDTVAEFAEAFQVELRSPSGATLGRSRAAVTIVDDDTVAALPVITVSDVVVDEKAGWADLVVRLDAASAGTVSVNYATADGTAEAGSDYAAVSGVLAFAPGEVVKTVRVAVLDDTGAEDEEAFRLALSNAQGAQLGQAQAQVTIAANDGPVQATPAISIEDAWVGEGDGVAQLLVRLSGPSDDPVSVDWRTSWASAGAYAVGQTARDGYSFSTDLDFSYAEGRLSFAPGELLKTISVPLYADPVVEAAETFRVQLLYPVNATMQRAFATATILDDDAAPPQPRVPGQVSDGFLGREIRVETFGSYLEHGYDLIVPQVRTVSDTLVEYQDLSSFGLYSGNQIPAAIDIGRTSITYEISSSAAGTFYAASFNGIQVSDADGLVPPIIGVSIDAAANSLGITADRVTFGENDIAVNVQGLPYQPGQGFTLHVSFGDAPTPAPAGPHILLGTPFPAGYRITPTQLPGGATSHRDDLYHGWDFVIQDGATLGAPVLAVAPGRVVFVYAGASNSDLTHLTERSQDDGSLGLPGALGNVVTLEHQIGGKTFYSSYVHLMQSPMLQDLSARWATAQMGGPDLHVEGGEAVGAVGNTGARKGTHLHFNLGSALGSFQYRDKNGILQTYSDYQIAKGPPSDPILESVRFADGNASDRLFQSSSFVSSGPAQIGEGGAINSPPIIEGESAWWLAPGTSVRADQYLTVVDPNGQPDLALVRFWDSTPGTDGGFLTLDNGRISGRFVDIDPTQMGRIGYTAGAGSGSNTILIEAFDRAGSASDEFVVDIQVVTGAVTSRAPTITPGSSLVVPSGSTTALTSLVRVADPDGASDLAAFRIIDPGGQAGNFSLRGVGLGSDSGWLPFSDFSTVRYVGSYVGDDPVSVQVRDAAGNITEADLVLLVRAAAASDTSDKLTLEALPRTDPDLLSASQWQRLDELGANALSKYADALHAFGSALPANALSLDGIKTQIFHGVTGTAAIVVKQLSDPVDALAALEVFGNALSAATAVAVGEDPASALYTASRDSVIALSSGKAGAIAAGLVLGAATAPVGLKLAVAVGAYIIVAEATEYLGQQILPEQVSSGPKWIREIADNFVDVYRELNPFDNGTGGGDGPHPPEGAAGMPAAADWIWASGSGLVRSFAGSEPEAWAFATKRYGLAGEQLEAGLEFVGDRYGSAAQDALIGSTADDRLDAKGSNDVLFGLGGNDTLIGGPGNDILDGGDGSDTADYSDAPGRVVVDLAITAPQNTLGGERDTLISIENLVGTGFNDTLRGDANDNQLRGAAGNDIIEGRDGNDTLDGGAGNDTAEYRSAGAGVRVSLLQQSAPQDTLGAGFDTLINFENLTGSAFDDTLIGDGQNNILMGLAGNDILEGGAGNDLLDGGEGIDLASYAGAPSAVKVYLNSASATLSAGTDYFVSIEGFVGSDHNDTLVGNAAANVLRGGAGNDRLFGLEGDDILRGGPGDDILYGDAGNDTADYSDATVTVRAVLGVNATVSTINFGRDRYFDIENLAGGSARDYLTGDGNANIIWGNGGNDIIDGGGGNDTLLGGEGNDDITGGLGADLIDLGPAAGNDIIRYLSAADSRAASMDRIIGFTASGPGFDRILFENAPGAIFPGVAPTAITLGASVAIASASSVADLVAQLGSFVASTAASLAVTRVDVAAGGAAGSYLVVNDTAAAFDPASDMLIGIQFASAAPLGAGNLILF